MSLNTSSGDHANTTHGVSEQNKLLEAIVHKLLFRDAYEIPKIVEAVNIKSHLDKMKHYFATCGMTSASDEAKTTVLLNSISEDMRSELCGILEFHEKQDNYEWIATKLIEMYHPKESKLSPYVKLFAHTQKHNQTTRDFLAVIRREGYKLLKMLDPQEREKYMIEAFCAGIYNADIRKALRKREFDTLDEVYGLIKKEKSPGQDEDGLLRMMVSKKTQEQVSDFEKLQNQVTMMQKQLAFIVSILQSDDRRKVPSEKAPRRQSYAQIAAKNIPGRINNRQPPIRQRENYRERVQGAITCYCCGREGHIARMCDIRCAVCGRQGHKANRCYTRQSSRQRNVRLLEEEHDNDWIEDDISSDTFTSTDHNLEEAEQQDIPCVNTIRTESKAVVPMKPILQRGQAGYKTKKPKSYPEDVERWADFVEGRTNKKPKTLISNNHSEKAANKPIIEGRCQGHVCRILCDSGAEVNVIDEALVREIQQNDSSVEITKSKKSLKCANNSTMHVVGTVCLRMSFASASKSCTFLVVKNLFPKVILGIRSMKGLRMIIDPVNNCVKVRNTTIPFLSKIYKETIIAQGNEQRSVLRVGGRQM